MGKLSRGLLALIAFEAFFNFYQIASARAGIWEASLGGSFNRSDYGDGNYAWTRKWGTSLGYHVTETTEFEVSFMDVTDVTSIAGFEDTTFHDQLYSLDWVQDVVGKDYAIQPYFKLGIGELNRTASGSYLGGAAAPPAILDEITGVIGAGLRVHITRNFALRGEAVTYLTGGAIDTWQQNYAITFGISIFF